MRAARAQQQPVADYFSGLPETPQRELSPDEKAATDWLTTDEAWRFAEALTRVPPNIRLAILSLARDLG